MAVRWIFIAGLTVVLMMSGGVLRSFADEKGRQDLMAEKTTALKPLEMATGVTDKIQKHILKMTKDGITSYILASPQMNNVALQGGFQVDSRIYDSVEGPVVLWSFDTVLYRLLVHYQFLVSIKTGRVLDYMQLKLIREGYSPDTDDYNKKLYEKFGLKKLAGGNCTEGTPCIKPGPDMCAMDTLTYQPADGSAEYSIIVNFPDRFRRKVPVNPYAVPAGRDDIRRRNYQNSFWRSMGVPVGTDILPDGTVVFFQGQQILFFSSETRLRNIRLGNIYIIRTSILKEISKNLYAKYHVSNENIATARGKKRFQSPVTCRLFWQAATNLAIYKALENDE